jgi:hypothetical protein
MKSIVLILILFSVLVPCAFAQQDSTHQVPTDSTVTKAVDSTVTKIETEPPSQTSHTTTYQVTPSIGFTYQSISKDEEESENLQWLAQLQAKFSYEGEPYQFNTNLFAQYGASVTRDAPPKKVQDHLQVSLVPSMTLSKKLGLRLFFEVTGETEMGDGVVDSVPTKFLDPLFLYETLFLGHKTHLVADDGNYEFEFVIGAGYAYQQTVTNNFVLAQNRQFVIDEGNPLQHVQDQFTVESGYSGILELAYTKHINDNFLFRASDRTVMLTKQDFTQDVKNSRVGSLLLAGLQYKFLSIDYTMHVLYDRNISQRRQLDQTMVFGLKFDL